MSAEAQPSELVRRRLLTVPAVIGMAVLALLLAPLLLPLLAIVDLLRGGRFAGLRLGAFALVYLACETAGLAAALAIWLLRRVDGNEDRYRERTFRLQCWWAGTLLDAAQAIYGFEIDVEGDEQSGRGPVLVYLRHASLADTLLGSALFAIPHRLRLRYVLKSELLFDPCLDVVGHRLPNVFVRRDGADSESEIRAVAALAQDLAPDEGVLIYPEGTRFTEAKRRRVIAKLLQRGDAELVARAKALEQVLPPRLGGSIALLESAPEADVVFCAHTGFEDAATVRDLWQGHLIAQRVQVRCRRFPRSRVPTERRARERWLLDRWQELDQWVRQHRKPVRSAI